MFEDRLSALYEGNPVQCTADEYHNGLRSAIQDFAGKMIDSGQDIRAIIALEEVRQLDAKFGAQEQDDE
jgi:hypothetical protein